MTKTRNWFTIGAVAAFALTLLPALPSAAAAQSSDIKVLVSPPTVQEGMDRNFGRKIAEEVRKSLEDFAGLQPIDWDEVEDMLDQFDLDERALTPIEWRQLAGRLSAQMVMVGQATNGGSGVMVDVSFVDPNTGDELPVEPFQVEDDDKHREAAQRIMTSLESGVEYTRAVAFCADYLGSEQWQDALNNCNRAIDMNASGTRAYYLRGRVYMGMEEWAQAIEDLEHVIELAPSNTEAIQSAAFAHAQAGNNERSLELYREYLTFNPDAADVRLSVAYNLSQAGLDAEAMQLLEEGIERDPENTDLLEYLGSVALRVGTQNGEVTDADALRVSAEAFEKVLEVKGDQVNPQILGNVVTVYAMLEDYDEAIAFSERAIAIVEASGSAASTPDSGSTGETEAAPAMSKDEMLASIYNARSNVYQRMENYQEASADLERALALNPQLEGVSRRVGLLKLQAGDREGAVTAFRQAVQEEGADPDEIANFLFSRAYNDDFEQGRISQALQQFAVAIEFAQAPDVTQQINFFTAYGHYQLGAQIDTQNEANGLQCEPARRALAQFNQVLGPLNASGNYQAASQAQIREAVSGQYGQIARQESIIRSKCR